MEVVDDALYTRALIAHLVSMSSRMVYPLIGIAYWQTAFENLEQRDDINHEFVESSKDILKYIVIVQIVLGVILDIVVLKARKYAHLIFYYETIQAIVQSFLPYDNGDNGRILQWLILAGMFSSYSCNLGKNMVGAFLTYIVITIFIWPLVFTD